MVFQTFFIGFMRYTQCTEMLHWSHYMPWNRDVHFSLFTESAHCTGPIQSYSRNVCMCVCLHVCAIAKHPIPKVKNTSEKSAYS